MQEIEALGREQEMAKERESIGAGTTGEGGKSINEHPAAVPKSGSSQSQEVGGKGLAGNGVKGVGPS